MMATFLLFWHHIGLTPYGHFSSSYKKIKYIFLFCICFGSILTSVDVSVCGLYSDLIIQSGVCRSFLSILFKSIMGPHAQCNLIDPGVKIKTGFFPAEVSSIFKAALSFPPGDGRWRFHWIRIRRRRKKKRCDNRGESVCSDDRLEIKSAVLFLRLSGHVQEWLNQTCGRPPGWKKEFLHCAWVVSHSGGCFMVWLPLYGIDELCFCRRDWIELYQEFVVAIVTFRRGFTSLCDSREALHILRLVWFESIKLFKKNINKKTGLWQFYIWHAVVSL